MLLQFNKLIRKTSYVSNIIQTFNSVYPLNFITAQYPKAQRELFSTWLQIRRSNFLHGQHTGLFAFTFPELQGMRKEACHLLPPSCPKHSQEPLHVVRTLLLLPRVRNKSPQPSGLHSCYHSSDISNLPLSPKWSLWPHPFPCPLQNAPKC